MVRPRHEAAGEARMPVNYSSLDLASLTWRGLFTNGQSFNASFSPVDSNIIVFTSTGKNVHWRDRSYDIDIFVRDLVTGKVTLVSVGEDGVAREGGSSDPIFSPDGRRIAFSSIERLVGGDLDNASDIYIRDLVSGTTTLVTLGEGYSFDPVFSPNGKAILFTTSFGSYQSLFVQDLSTGTIEEVSVKPDGTRSYDFAGRAAFSSDGMRVLFQSNASDLVSGDTNGREDIFVRDLSTGTTTRVSTSRTGAQANGTSEDAAWSPDGTKVVFVSDATNLVPNDRDRKDIFVKDLTTGEITLVSTTQSGSQADSGSFSPGFSPDGTRIAFVSQARNLVPGERFLNADIFIKDLSTGAIRKIPVRPDDGSYSGDSGQLVFSADGRKLLFISDVRNLVFSAAPRGQVYAIDLAGTNGDDRLLGLGGELALGLDGNDTLVSSTGGDTLLGGRGDDRLEGSSGDDLFRFRGAFGADVLSDTGGSDQLMFEDRRAAGARFRIDGADLVIEIGEQSLRLLGHVASRAARVETAVFMDGSIDLSNPEAFAVFIGTPDADTMIGSVAGDTIRALAGHDTIDGLNGSDTLDGGTGNDVVRGGEGDDTIAGDRGMDELHGDAGDDTIAGGLGADRIEGGTGDDTILGGQGGDRLAGGEGNDVLDGDEGGDRLRGDAGDDRLRGGDGEDLLLGAADDDTLEGGAGDDELRGGEGRDTLRGGDGDDILTDNDGLAGYSVEADILDGGAGNDILFGQGGATIYLFGRGAGSDVVHELSYAIDTIRIDPALTLADLDLMRDGADLVVGVRGTGDTMRVLDHYDPSALHRVEHLELGSGARLHLESPAIPLRLGNAPDSLPRDDPAAWERAWNPHGFTIEHKADGSDAAEPWTRASFGTDAPGLLAGTDIARGELGVSGSTAATGAVPQEIDGTEALRIGLRGAPVDRVTLSLTSLLARDTGTIDFEAGRLRAFTADGSLIDEAVFRAEALDGRATTSLAFILGTETVVVDAGAYDDAGVWHPGAYVDRDGRFAGDPSGTLGSDFLIERVDLELALIG